jgi:hypothetical protein
MATAFSPAVPDHVPMATGAAAVDLGQLAALMQRMLDESERRVMAHVDKQLAEKGA